jgi:hypothetical protein
VRRLHSRVVPLIPIARNPVFTHSQAEDTLMGRVLVFFCADGEHHVEITPDSVFEFEEAPVVFVRPYILHQDALAYRLAYRLRVYPGSDPFASWTITVDAIDGSLLNEQADFICD